MGLLSSFMKQISMHPDQTDIHAVTESFLHDMDMGLRGEARSLPMIPTYISALGTPPENKPVITVDAGGTNLRIGLVSFQNGVPVNHHFEKHAMPGTKGEMSAEEFFESLTDMLYPLTKQSDTVGFGFSYPVEILENRDGKIILLNKEVQVRGAGGYLIGETLKRKLAERGVTEEMKFVVLNDTVATLMGTAACFGLENVDGVAALVLGTGCNSCYMEKGEKILKLNHAGDMIVNCESGGFTGGGGGKADDVLDCNSGTPGTFRFEKMMSGIYLGRLVTHIARLAADAGLMSAAFGNPGGEYFTATELDSFIRGGENRICAMCKGSDAETLSGIVDMVFERAAKLICANIAALCIHCDGGKKPETPFLLAAEGSMFQHALLFRDKLDYHLDTHIRQGLGRFVAISTAEDATMAGSALAALLN